MKLAIASGKGGTGKTTVALCLALSADGPVRLLDCDVEEPNCHLFLKPEIRHREPVMLPVPVVDAAKCDGCGKCRQLCQFNAIAVLKGKAVVFPELCHSCGGCVKVCPTHAIREVECEIGFVEQGTSNGVEFVTGSLNVGQPLAPAIIRAVKRHANGDGLTILDCPPGTACAMVASVRDADHVLLVTEPTPFGLHDLKLAVDTVRELKRSFSVVINRADIGDNRVLDYCRAENIPVRLQIPEGRRIAEAYSRGEPVLAAAPELQEKFRQLLAEVTG
ncbi:MAG: (4Fe-4S)-binding protein [Verrucomicrobia bacterium]|nr:(4Fe-4S)-binding protein [Verrucomicrobiota bacterium]